MSRINLIKSDIESHIETATCLINESETIEIFANEILQCFKNKGKVLLIGNGGSAADAQHIAAELVGRFTTERVALPAIALTTDSSILTSISNDYGYDSIFSRQISAFAKPEDVIIAISTSGNSKNIIQGINEAKKIGCMILGLTGNKGGEIAKICKNSIVVQSRSTARIQEMHILIGHILCNFIDQNLDLLFSEHHPL